MNHYVSIRFEGGKEYNFRLKDGDAGSMTRDEALRWIDEQFANAGCEVANPVGKTVLADKILALAKAYGSDTFAQRTQWAEKFVRCVGLATGKAHISVDIPGNSVGF